MSTIKYAWHFLMRSKSYSIISILGLAFSLASSIILLRYIHRELTVDTHCINREKVYGVKVNLEGGVSLSGIIQRDGDEVLIDPQNIEHSTRVIPLEDEYISIGTNRFAAKIIATDSAFFRLFHYPVIQGNTSLNTPQSALITKAYANKLFGKENPIGKILHTSNDKDVTIEGVINEPKNKTLMHFDIVLSFELSRFWSQIPNPIRFYSFQPGTDVQQLNHIGNTLRYIDDPSCDSRKYTFSFIPVKDIYWDSSLNWRASQIFSPGTYSHLLILSGVCLLLLLIGILNFINFYLISMLHRGKEYGLKKVFGAKGKNIFLQIWMENMLLIGIALSTAWFVIELSAIPIEKWFNYHFAYTTFDWQLTLAIGILLPLLTSIYPFVKYNHSTPITSIRSINHGSNSVFSRLFFLGIQYMITYLLIVLSLYFNQQLDVMLQTDPGFRTKDIIIAHLAYKSNDPASVTDELYKLEKERATTISNELSSCPAIESWANGSESILQGGHTINVVNHRGEKASITGRTVSPNFFRVFNLKMIDGDFSQQNTGEYAPISLLINQAALKALKYDNYKDASFHLENNQDRNITPTAVVDDYYNGHLTLGKTPTLFAVIESSGDIYQIACVAGKTETVIKFLHTLMYKVCGSEDFEYSFLEDDVRAVYDKDRQVATIYFIFSGIAIVISCMGLFGISLFDIRKHYREIAIRKINGAQLKDLYLLLFRKYIIILGISFLLAIPIVCYIIYEYTKDFIVKMPINISIFIEGMLVVTLISVGTLLWQIHKAARIDPAKILQSE